LQHLPVRPYIVLQRGYVEIAHEDGRYAGHDVGLQPLHLLDEIELVAELRIDRSIGLVTPGRNIEIVEPDAPRAAFEKRRNVPRVTDTAIVLPVILEERHLRGDGNPVIPLLAMDDDVRIAEVDERLERKFRLLALDLLQAEDIRLIADEELLHDWHPQPNRVDVPGGDGKCH